jgi:hypothetical protein
MNIIIFPSVRPRYKLFTTRTDPSGTSLKFAPIVSFKLKDVNRIPVIRVLEVRVTVFFTSKIQAIKKIKRILLPALTEVRL